MKKTISLILAVIMMTGALAITAVAAPKVPAPTPEVGAREAVILNAGFHCNANGGNGRVWVEAYDVKYAADKALKNKGIGGVMEDLIYLSDNCWLLANQTDYVCPKCGSTVWVSYSNKSGVPDGKNIQLTHGDVKNTQPTRGTTPETSASLTFEKRVEDKNIVEWLNDKGYNNVSDILKGLEFYLEGPAAYGPVTPNSDGMVVFSEIKPGTYRLSEKVTGAASVIFKEMVPVEITVAEGDNNHFVLGGTVNGNIDGPVIEPTDKFTIINGYGTWPWVYDDSGIGYPGLNASGHIFYIGVKNVRTGEELYSFCANGGSTAFGAGEYLIGHSMQELDWIMAFNYINDKYGDLNKNRVITQVVTWALLGSVNVNSEAFEDTKLTEAEKDAIKDVMENYDGYVGAGKVVDVLFMTYVDTPFENGQPNYTACQPQIVPVFGTFYVENELKEDDVDPVDPYFYKTKYDGLLPVKDGEFEFELFKVGDDKVIDTFFTDGDGKVDLGYLDPGKYAIKEVWKLVFDGGLGFDEFGNPRNNYNLVWKAEYPGERDGLYFEVNADGMVIWESNFNGTLNNVIYCKHSALWAPDEYDPSWSSYEKDVVDLGKGNGKILFFGNFCCGTLEVINRPGETNPVPPTCERSGILWLGCSENCGIGTGMEFGEQLKHIEAPFGLGAEHGYVWYACQNGCGTGYVKYNLDDWYAFGGWALPDAEIPE